MIWAAIKCNTSVSHYVKYVMQNNYNSFLLQRAISLEYLVWYVFCSIRQNAELAKLRQDCIRLNKELTEKNEALQAEEQLKKSLESKAAMAEKQLAQLQVWSPPCSLLLFLSKSLHQKWKEISLIKDLKMPLIFLKCLAAWALASLVFC